MRSLFENKRWILMFAALALVSLTVLAVSLDEIPFRGAQRFVREEAQPMPVPVIVGEEDTVEIPLWQQLMVLMLFVLLAVLVGLLLSPEGRKRMFRLMIRMGVTIWAIYFLFKNYGDQLFGFSLQQQAGDALTDETALPMPAFEPPQVSPIFSYLISFAIALVLLGVVWVFYRGWQRYLDLKPGKPLEEIARIARSSLADLSSGRNSSDVIINCYLRMSDVVSHKRQLQRGIAMTPHEFAIRLEQAGLPGDAVNRLTRLFEAVRYGDRKSGPKDVNEAVHCLKTILHYCGEPV